MLFISFFFSMFITGWYSIFENCCFFWSLALFLSPLFFVIFSLFQFYGIYGPKKYSRVQRYSFLCVRVGRNEKCVISCWLLVLFFLFLWLQCDHKFRNKSIKELRLWFFAVLVYPLNVNIYCARHLKQLKQESDSTWNVLDSLKPQKSHRLVSNV